MSWGLTLYGMAATSPAPNRATAATSIYTNEWDNSDLINPLTYPVGINGTVQITCDIENADDIDTEYQRLLAAGATPIIAPVTWPWGMRSFFVADPEGNQIEILAHTKG
jgi:uncharacterized glyoxalase superfamily protein PhnB